MNSSSLIIEQLCQRKKSIIRAWLEGIWNSSEFKSAQSTPLPQLLDHIPALLDDLADYLRLEGGEETENHARIHGTHRWHQHFSLHEVLSELLMIRRIIIREVDIIHDEYSEVTEDSIREVRRRLAAFFDGVLIYSASQYSEQQQAQIEADAKLITIEYDSVQAGLQAVDAARLRLLRVISHELRNLLNGATLTVESLVQEDDPHWIEKLRQILKNSHSQMLALVNQLLDVAPLLAGQEPLKLAPLDLKEFLKSQEVVFGGMASVKNLTFACELEEPLKSVVTDEAKLQRIITNLVQNALKYTNAGLVTLRFETRSEKTWAVKVSDTGPGIPQEDAGKIFDEFHRVPGTEHLPGTGLGLSIVKQLVDVMNGEVLLEQTGPGGSAFVVNLPRNAA